MNQTVNNKKSILYYNVYLMFFVSSFLVFQFAGYTFLLWFEMLFCLLNICAENDTDNGNIQKNSKRI